MSLTLFDDGVVRVMVSYVQKKGNTFYFRRRIPDDVRSLYPKQGKTGRLFFSLKTTDARRAAELARRMARQQDALWIAHRHGQIAVGPDTQAAALAMLGAHELKPGEAELYRRYDLEPDAFLSELAHLSGGDDGQIIRGALPPHAELAASLFYGTERLSPFLSEALRLYQELEDEPEGSKEHAARQRAVSRFIEHAGDMPAEKYSRENARSFIETLAKQDLKSGTIKRYINYISPVFNMAVREYELGCKNIFERVRIPGLGKDTKERYPFTSDELIVVQRACADKDDDIRWLAALLSDTGMRLAEGVGLEREDIDLSGPVPVVHIRPNSIRGLKTAGSERTVPLVGAAKWAAVRLLETQQGPMLFPRYASAEAFKPTHASNTLKKWFASLGIEKTAHSFRHSMRDRLRNVGAPSELADRVGGWSRKNVGEGYGQGYSRSVMHRWMSQIVLPAGVDAGKRS